MPSSVNKPLNTPLGLPAEPNIKHLIFRWTELFASVEEFYTPSSTLIKRLRNRTTTCSTPEQAAELYLLLAEAARQHARTDMALSAVSRALELLPEQWLGHHIYLLLLEEEKRYTEALSYLDGLLTHYATIQVPDWDDLPAEEVLWLHRAHLACLLSQWEDALQAFRKCYPHMRNAPHSVLRPWFILTLYTNNREEAFQVAYHLLQDVSVETADALLQVFTLHRWFEEAAQLYKALYRHYPDHTLLHRRLLALYIKLGELEKARELAHKGSVFHAA